MLTLSPSPIAPTEPSLYQIRLAGQLGPQWADWFDGLTLTHAANGDTLLTGPVADQAALYGLLKKVRDLGMPLLAVARLEPALTSIETSTEHITRS